MQSTIRCGQPQKTIIAPPRSVSTHVRPNPVWRDDSLPFQHGVKVVRLKTADLIHRSGRPANLDTIDLSHRTQTEVQPQIALREITPSAMDLIRLCNSARRDLHARIQSEAITLRSGEFKTHPVTSGHACIPQHHRASIEIVD